MKMKILYAFYLAAVVSMVFGLLGFVGGVAEIGGGFGHLLDALRGITAL